MKRWILVVLIALALAAVVVIVGFTQIKLDALQEPGHLETVIATQAKHLLVRWNSRDGIPPAPTDLQASVDEGDKLYGIECAMCHGPDGHTTSPAVQQYSDRELFWIVKNGIRLSGMPAFGRVESDEHIWNLSHYVRTLRRSAPPENESAAH
jgi:mono/diheme cytochrome c family protein